MKDQQHWTAHPNKWVKAWIAADVPKHLRPTMVALADAIDRRVGAVWQTQKAMAAEWGIPLRTFEHHLKKLEELGVIEREARYRKQGPLAGTRTSDLIRFGIPPDDIDRALAALDDTTRHDDGGLSGSQPATQVAVTTRHDGGGTDSPLVPSTKDSLAPLASPSLTRLTHTPGPNAEGDASDDAGEGRPRGGRCVDCNGDPRLVGELDEGCCAECWAWREAERQVELEQRAVALEAAAADPVVEAEQDAGALAAEVQAAVEATDAPAGAAAGEDGRGGGVVCGHGQDASHGRGDPANAIFGWDG